MNNMFELLLFRSCAQNIYRMFDVRACVSSIRSVTWHFRSQFLTRFMKIQHKNNKIDKYLNDLNEIKITYVVIFFKKDIYC